MNKEILFIAGQLKDAYQGEPWFGRNMQELLREVSEENAFRKIANQHSILELLWHTITWRQFTISRLEETENKTLQHFEEEDWRILDHNDNGLWQQGLERLHQTQTSLISLLEKQQDTLLDKIVSERKYNFRKLLHGVIQHDIYHLGQIAYLNKQLQGMQ